MSAYEFRQVDVFTNEPLLGNPVAVVHGADGLGEDQMAAFARWTNLSETTFLLEPSDPAADYRLRIFTPGGELPFAGHPTLGSAHAWLEAGGEPKGADVVQECGVGLVSLQRGERLAFAAPELLQGGPVEEGVLERIAAGLRIEREEILDAQWADNGPGWVAVMLRDAAAVLALTPDPTALGDLAAGAVGAYPPGEECAVEVRAFVGGLGVDEDPVTGSLNAGIAQWLAGGVLPAAYVASQGTVMKRRGRVHVSTDHDNQIWVGGDTLTTIHGSLSL
ncbi:PhzF family phenazine biosynthesis protein [Nocardioides albertanoniae]|uniref:PhzF family phenazine biosynthesis protein n=1 Tax=Nocardioides albertanoniae TaxID=1175486 RepID=A0A543A6D2_9ACTN|nr:PhzF family phenazine biosynthesis protein [Nocardioides albertanoniae]TQL68046.1 PhzF family phenazine biosynthesis protein [Nocardioides albertanoniae]